MGKRIVIASILKPIDDTRMFEKFGVSLAQTNKYETNIIGFSSKNKPIYDGITFYPLYRFHRLHPNRLLAPVKLFIKLVKLKPDLTIVNTPELLLVMVLNKILFGGKLIYDIRENYYLNILVDRHWSFLKRLVAGLVRMIEKISSYWVDHYMLAEKTYLDELPFVGSNYTVVENKYRDLSPTPVSYSGGNKKQLLFTGTISLSYGIMETISLFKKLHKIDPELRLTIIGYCAHPPTRLKIRKEIESDSAIEVIGLDYLVPHSEIIQAIRRSGFGMVAYQLNPSNQNCLPTRLFEYLANQLPVLLNNNPVWVDLCDQYDACIPIDYADYDPSWILNQMNTRSFYSREMDNSMLWSSQEEEFLKTIESTIS